MSVTLKEIAAEAERLGITQGQLIEEMWSIYKNKP